MHKQSISVYDLDGTILEGNSFHKYLVFLAKSFVLRGRFLSFASLSWLMAMRLARKITHYELKKGVVDIASVLPERKNELFAEELAACCYDRLNQLRMHHETSGTITVLATAAPSIYARYLEKFLSFDFVISSEYVEGTYVERIRQNKADAISEMIRQRDGAFTALFTDHHDDLYSAKLASHVILVDPAEKTLKEFDSNNLSYLLFRFSA